LKYETASDERDKKRILHEEAVQTGKTEKVTKIANDLEKIGVVTEQAQDQLAHANEQLRVDIEKWKESKDEDLKDMFLNWSSNHIHYHERMFHEWEELLGLLKDLNSDDLIS
jgi:delta 1-pyrroline-5-carboxylate dehydrogenase